MNSTTLERAVQYIVDLEANFHSVIVVRHNYIVAERYFSPIYDVNNTHALFSATKSVVSCLIGIAMDLGFIDGVDQKVLDFFPGRICENLDERKESMTLRHLLTMTAGFDWNETSYTDFDNDFFRMRASGDWAQYILDRPMVAEPGQEFLYNSGNSHLLATIINVTTGMTPLQFADQYLFGALGITRRAWLTDPHGVNFGGADLALTPRDMAKIGLLYLYDGFWDGMQVVNSSWIESSTSFHTETYGFLNYGYQWWIDPEFGTISARGYQGQKIFILPEHDMVVVFTGNILDPTERYDDIVHYHILPALLVSATGTPWSTLLVLCIGSTLAICATVVLAYRRR